MQDAGHHGPGKGLSDRRILKLTLAYDGTEFRGWQRLPGKARTVQAVLERVLGEVLGEPIEVAGAGRTDSGVHAAGQVASFSTASGKACASILRSLDGALPPDLAAICLEDAAPRFHARYLATGKLYRYRLSVSPRPDPFTRRYALRVIEPLDLAAMRAAGEALVGRRDFSAFTNLKGGDKSRVRDLRAVRVIPGEGLVDLEFEGDGFLYNQVRIMAGVLVEAGALRLDAQAILALLERGERAAAPGVLDPRGLCLLRVDYEQAASR